ncbi:hypothetical protein TWF481_007412 [Arthrobotrys musiformis]|uniref:Peptidase S8/S53 domain-containing protein n=1 Tax=Arthrobotrys musiformis TaxID=47236 RepID=A0AAV9WH56_9PEZI
MIPVKLVLYLFHLIVYYSFPVFANFRSLPKVGTWGVEFTHLTCIVKPEFYHNTRMFDALDKEFLDGSLASLALLTPRKRATFKSQSKYLGVRAYTIITPLNYYRHRGEVYRDEVSRERGAKKEKRIIDNLERIIIAMAMLFTGTTHNSNTKNHADYPFVKCNPYPSDVFSPTPPSKIWYNKPPRHLIVRKPYWWRKSVERNVPGRDIAVTRDAMPDLPFLSWPWSIMFQYQKQSRLGSSYYHYKRPGEGAVVYVLDSGVDTSHPDLKNAKITSQIFGGPFPQEEGADTLANTRYQAGHGTQIVGKIVGRLSGVAQAAKVVAGYCTEAHTLPTIAADMDCLLKTYDHIKTYNAKRPCIINMSSTYPFDSQDPLTSPLRLMFTSVLHALHSLPNVIIVTAAGNQSPVS